tara:strand:- start:339 stop:497 length:159 start_codon:yes stop_codon:yes gene_type:complete
MNQTEEMVKFKLLIAMDQLESGENLDDDALNLEIESIYKNEFGENVKPLFLN